MAVHDGDRRESIQLSRAGEKRVNGSPDILHAEELTSEARATDYALFQM